MEAEEFKDRKAPYAPVSALEEFLEKIPNVTVPSRVDRAFLQKLSVARGNEWALLSSLKFLGIINQQGAPTAAYRSLLSTESRTGTLRRLVEKAYSPLFELGGLNMSTGDLVNYFRVASSPSQARNAARFFRSVSELAGVDSEPKIAGPGVGAAPASRPSRPNDLDTSRLLAEAKVRLLDKLPAPRADWEAEAYAAICQQFLEMLRHLDR